jgi:DNA-binding MarR family transcriptional regulator
MRIREKSFVAPVERATHLVALYLDRALSGTEVTQAEAHLLARLARGSASPGELHAAFGHKRSTLTSVLDRLEARGFIRRTPHPDDRRSFLITLTPAGHDEADTVVHAVARLERAVSRRTTAEERDGFAATLAALEVGVTALLDAD